ncbi:hypothetical protein DNU06_03820 [Putridiphycobacter roseus]|uniref:Uncharacterized protein n=1 Tax=Putridiphycobacter roseus TaxID=2219161 RepID=A0A2W1NEA6_9FLAO|nr:hypothetical protein [Putridiphycobacter roseus]PZE17755.1 hypothetical protein DNU06_03820 [Putridiphycobacter roseus]
MKNLLIGFILLISFQGIGQNFSADPESFIKQVDKYLSAINRGKTKAFIEEFTPVWMNEFSPAYRSRVVSTSNLILEKRLSGYPDLYGYLFSAYSFVKNKQPAESFESWHATIDKLLQSKKVQSFKEFIETCAGLFDNGVIFSNTRHEWMVAGGTYQFDFIKNKPEIQFNDVKLKCLVINKNQSRKADKYSDSTVLYHTTGVYQPLIEKWEGRGGEINWAKTGLDPLKNKASITDYTMSLKATKISSDSAFVNTDFYDRPLWGSFTDMAKSDIKDGNYDYPQFISFSKKIVKKNILKDVDYVGGFALNGSNFIGIGLDNEPASLIFFKDNKTFVKATGMRFSINQKGVYVEDCRTTLYLNAADSIFHPGLILKYDIESIEMSRDKEGLAQAPFSNSFHQLDMYMDKLVWRKSDNNLTLEWNFGSNNKIAKFESKEYFNARLYSQIQGMNATHPLVAVYKYYYKYDKETYPISEAANFMGLSTNQIVPILLDLSNLGFITYNSLDKTITILPKTKKYIDARAGKTDYDDIVFISDFNQITKQPATNPDGTENKDAASFNERADRLNKRKFEKMNFGTINLVSLDLSLNELDPIKLSTAQSVVVFPKNGEILLQENRNFLFEGAISAGKAEVYLDNGAFNYSDFKINLSEVSAALFRVRPIFGGGTNFIPMTSHLSKFEGELLIDNADNKAGNNSKITNYPILSTKKNAYIYYNHPSIFKGTYDSASFYFKLDPFEFDSLDNFSEQNVAFDGEMRSSGIFPVFKEKIRIQEDYAFGFKTVAPAEGYRFYGNDAKYKNDIRLSNRGLRGSGEINFLTSNTKSEDFVFFADSTMGVSNFINTSQSKADGLDVPDVIASNALVTYIPKQKILKTESKDESMYLYNSEVVMAGRTILTPQGMTGLGATYFGKAEYKSKQFELKQTEINADTADFNLADIDTVMNKEIVSFETINVKGHVDFKERVGRFESNDGTSIVNFPENQYICYMDVFNWLMDDDQLDMEKKDLTIESDLDIAESNFFSVHPKQDSLNFRSPRANFDIKSKVLTCNKVDYIDVADARITPDNNIIIIYKKAVIDPMENAVIVANFITKYHQIINANVDIKARRKYKATGDYTFIDANKKEQLIHFDEISLDSAYQTTATGKIASETNFKLSDQFDFYGNVKLKASTKYLTFDGATRINHNCDQFAKNWMKFTAEIDPNNILIPVNEKMKDLEGNDIAVGLILRNTSDYDSLGVYPAFLSSLENKTDKVLFTSSGVLTYNDQAKEYRIASSEKLINRAEKGNYISLHTQSCSMKGDGIVDLNIDIPDVALYTVGNIEYIAATGITSMNLSGSIAHFYDKKAMEFMSNGILATEGLAGIDFNRTSLEQSIKELVDEKTAENFKSDYTIKGEIKKVPKEMEKPIYFTNLKLQWDNRNKAFLSKPISGIANLYEVPIMRDFTVKFAIAYSVKNADRGDKLMYMVDLPGNTYYYYNFERLKKDTKLQVFTTDKLLEAYLLALKEDKRKQKKLGYEFSNKTIYIAQFKSLFGE